MAEKLKYSILLVYLIICTVTDIKEHRIPTVPSVIFLIIGSLISVFENGAYFWLGMLPAAILLAGYVVTRGGVGLGDALMVLVAGEYLGLYICIEALMYGLFVSSVYGAVLAIRRNKWKGTRLAFSPGFLLGTVVALLVNAMAV